MGHVVLFPEICLSDGALQEGNPAVQSEYPQERLVHCEDAVAEILAWTCQVFASPGAGHRCASVPARVRSADRMRLGCADTRTDFLAVRLNQATVRQRTGRHPAFGPQRGPNRRKVARRGLTMPPALAHDNRLESEYPKGFAESSAARSKLEGHAFACTRAFIAVDAGCCCSAAWHGYWRRQAFSADRADRCRYFP